MKLFNESFSAVVGIAIIVPLLLLWVASFVDLFRRKDLAVFRKVLWATLILLTAYVGIAIYFVARPIRAPEGKRYGTTAPRTRDIVDGIEGLREQHAEGAVDDETYLTEKRLLLGLRP